MRVPTYSSSESVIAQIQKLTADQAKLQKQVATNQRIFNPEDDPAAVGRLLGIDTERRQLLQFKNNASLALDLARASYGNLDGLGDLAARAGELATLGGGASGAEANRAYAAEVNQLIEQAVQIGNARFNGDYLFSGTAFDTEPYAVARDAGGDIISAAYAGNAGESPVALSGTASIAPRTGGDTNAGIGDFINRLVSLRDALGANDETGITAARAALEESVDMLAGAVSQNGAVQLRIQVNQTLQTSRLTSLDQLASGEADIDMASAIVRLSQTTTSYEAALASGSRMLQLSLLDYL